MTMVMVTANLLHDPMAQTETEPPTDLWALLFSNPTFNLKGIISSTCYL